MSTLQHGQAFAPPSDNVRQFEFGANWKSFSKHSLTVAAIDEARRDFVNLMSGIELRSKSFLDIGCGAGLSLLIAASLGANVIGCDVDSLCAEILQHNRNRYFPALAAAAVPVIIGSILDEPMIDRLRLLSPSKVTHGYDVVHAWGSLHHTGDMEKGIRAAGSLVVPGGYLILAIYSRHWSSKMWRSIKRFYNRSHRVAQRAIVALLWPLIFLAKLIVTRRNPLRQTRGMNFHHDVVDWIGGYPYEFATPAEIRELLQPLGFSLIRIIPATVPTGCNQFVFQHRHQ
jgi:2-polyprenyl-6-hydroxyphenyl methylase/3-demethylubiquinone-9 3-methyltransferase